MITKSRYDNIRSNCKCEYVPYMPIIKQNTDYYILFDSNTMSNVKGGDSTGGMNFIIG